MKEHLPEIYFACSIRGGRSHAGVYESLVRHIQTRAQVLTEIFADGALSANGSPEPSDYIWKRDLDWVSQADGLIAEVTNPSLGVGYEIAKAESWHKPVLALFHEDGSHRLSAMIDGSPGTEVVRYHELSDAFIAINGFIRTLRDSE